MVRLSRGTNRNVQPMRSSIFISPHGLQDVVKAPTADGRMKESYVKGVADGLPSQCGQPRGWLQSVDR